MSWLYWTSLRNCTCQNGERQKPLGNPRVMHFCSISKHNLVTCSTSLLTLQLYRCSSSTALEPSSPRGTKANAAHTHHMQNDFARRDGYYVHIAPRNALQGHLLGRDLLDLARRCIRLRRADGLIESTTDVTRPCSSLNPHRAIFLRCRPCQIAQGIGTDGPRTARLHMRCRIYSSLWGRETVLGETRRH